MVKSQVNSILPLTTVLYIASNLNVWPKRTGKGNVFECCFMLIYYENMRILENGISNLIGSTK